MESELLMRGGGGGSKRQSRQKRNTHGFRNKKATHERLFDFVWPRGRRPCHVGRNVTIKWRPPPLTSPAVNRLVLIASC